MPSRAGCTLLSDLDDAEQAAGKELVEITHTVALTGGEQQVPDARYRQLLLAAPRSIWTAEAIGRLRRRSENLSRNPVG